MANWKFDVSGYLIRQLPKPWTINGATWSTDIPTLTYVPDDNFEQALIDLG